MNKEDKLHEALNEISDDKIKAAAEALEEGIAPEKKKGELKGMILATAGVGAVVAAAVLAIGIHNSRKDDTPLATKEIQSTEHTSEIYTTEYESNSETEQTAEALTSSDITDGQTDYVIPEVTTEEERTYLRYEMDDNVIFGVYDVDAENGLCIEGELVNCNLNDTLSLKVYVKEINCVDVNSGEYEIIELEPGEKRKYDISISEAELCSVLNKTEEVECSDLILALQYEKKDKIESPVYMPLNIMLTDKNIDDNMDVMISDSDDAKLLYKDDEVAVLMLYEDSALLNHGNTIRLYIRNLSYVYTTYDILVTDMNENKEDRIYYGSAIIGYLAPEHGKFVNIPLITENAEDLNGRLCLSLEKTIHSNSQPFEWQFDNNEIKVEISR